MKTYFTFCWVSLSILMLKGKYNSQAAESIDLQSPIVSYQCFELLPANANTSTLSLPVSIAFGESAARTITFHRATDLQAAVFNFEVPFDFAKTYILEYKESLQDPVWTLIREYIGKNDLRSITETFLSKKKEFYWKLSSQQTHHFTFPLGPPYSPLGTILTKSNDKTDGWYVAQDFGERSPDFHNWHHLAEDWNSEYPPNSPGQDDDIGKPVFAIESGVVVYANDAGDKWNGVVVIKHESKNDHGFNLPNGARVKFVWSLYAHLDKRQINKWVDLQEHSWVEARSQIGVIGDAPVTSTSAHLHFEIRTLEPTPITGPGYAAETDGWVNPSDFIKLNP